MTLRTATILLSATMSAAGAADTDSEVLRRTEHIVRESFADATADEIKTRLSQDENQTICSRYQNAPPAELSQKLIADAGQHIRYPEDGRLLGDWRAGEKLASIGTGGHIGRLQPDPPDRPRGGNCYACHVLAKKEVAAGNLGPNLNGYGKQRGTSAEAVKYTYDKIYNAQAFYACSKMPRFGYNGWLTPKQIADSVAFLLDPESPVNK